MTDLTAAHERPAITSPTTKRRKLENDDLSQKVKVEHNHHPISTDQQQHHDKPSANITTPLPTNSSTVVGATPVSSLNNNNNNNNNDIYNLSNLGLSSQVEAALNRIFSSGLFQRKDIDGRALEFLSKVPTQSALTALEDIQKRDFSSVRNKPAFIMSIFKRIVHSSNNLPPPTSNTYNSSSSSYQPYQPSSYNHHQYPSYYQQQQQQPTPPPPPPSSNTNNTTSNNNNNSSNNSSSTNPAPVPASALAHLPQAVSDALQNVFASGVCHPRQFDDRAMDILVDLQEQDAVRALTEFAAMEPGRVRNPSAFWMGLAKRFKNHMKSTSSVPGGSRFNNTPSSRNNSNNNDSKPLPASGPINPNGAKTGTIVLSQAITQKLDDLANSGRLPRNSLDDRALEALTRLPESESLGVLNEIPDLARVRNISAYVMGLCKKFANGEARSLSSRGPPPYAASGYSSGGYSGGGYSGGGYSGGGYSGGGYSGGGYSGGGYSGGSYSGGGYSGGGYSGGGYSGGGYSGGGYSGGGYSGGGYSGGGYSGGGYSGGGYSGGGYSGGGYSAGGYPAGGYSGGGYSGGGYGNTSGSGGLGSAGYANTTNGGSNTNDGNDNVNGSSISAGVNGNGSGVVNINNTNISSDNGDGTTIANNEDGNKGNDDNKLAKEENDQMNIKSEQVAAATAAAGGVAGVDERAKPTTIMATITNATTAAITDITTGTTNRAKDDIR